MEHWDTIVVERLALADDLDDLTDAQWATPSLCGRWTVRDVVGHLVVPHKTSLARFGVQMIKAAGSFDKASCALALAEGQRPAKELVADLRRFADGRFTPPGFDSVAPLTDVLLHSLDIRIPLGLSTERPVEPYRHALDLLFTKKGARGFVPGGRPAVHAVATDLDWAGGSGAEVQGTAVDLALALSGRGPRVDALSGPGQAALAAWLPR